MKLLTVNNAKILSTVITLFRCGNIFGWHLLPENLLLEYYSSMKIFLH